MTEKLTLNKDQIVVLQRESKNLLNNLALLEHFSKAKEIDKENIESILSLCSSNIQTLKESFDFNGEKNKRIIEMEESIGSYYEKQISILKNALEKDSSFTLLQSLTETLFKKIDEWWSGLGFSLVTEKSISSLGKVVVHLGFTNDPLLSTFSLTPSTDEKKLLDQISFLKNQGFEFNKNKNIPTRLLDNDNNRKLFISLLKDYLPSSRILKIENYYDSSENEFILHYARVLISDLNDIDNLIIPDNEFLLNI